MKLIRLKLPFPTSPLNHVNSYLILNEQSILIDPGPDHPLSAQVLQSKLAELGLDLSQINNVIITHFHVDHLGLGSRIWAKFGIKLMLGSKDLEFLRKIRATHAHLNRFLSKLSEYYLANGVPPGLLSQMISNHPGFRKLESYPWIEHAIPIESNPDLAGFEPICTPGHTPGHICLYEPRKRLLISGDTVLPEITPHIDQLPGYGNPLRNYLRSLEKISKLDISKVFPGHGDPFGNPLPRIQHLIQHHSQRLNQILELLENGAMNAYQLAQLISWDVRYSAWEEFPIIEKFFAVAETLSHLKLLESRGKVRKQIRNGIWVYTIEEY